MSGLHKKIKTFLLAVLMALPATVYAQMEEYSSRVVDAETGEPLPMATVQGAAESTVTNIEGLFSVKADAGDVLKISYIGYKSVSIKASDIKTRIRLKPADIQLKEIEVKPFTSTLRKIVKKSVSALSSNTHRRANYLYRQTTTVDGVTSSMVEAFFNANSAYNVCGMALITGSYSQSDKDTDSTLSYIASLYPLSEIVIVQNERVPLAYSMQLMPLNMDYDRYYDVSHETIDDGERKIYSIEFKPKGNYDMRVFDGKLFVDAQTLRLLKAEGRLLNVKVETDYNHFYAGVLNADVGFTVCFNEKSKYGEVQSVCISAEFKDMMHSQRFSSILYNVGDRNVGRAKWTRRKEDLRLQIDRMGYDKQFWRDNEIVKRTAVEAELARLREENFDKPNDKTTVSPTKEERTNDGNKPADNGYGNKNYKDLATADSIQKYFSLVQQERVYMHFDNTSYYKGDSIWFKAYVVGERDLKNINASKILYVELVNPYGIPVETKKLVISRGQAHGCMALADTINAGYYEVRAYTSWMLNFCRGDKHGNPFFYQKRTKDILGNHYQRFLYNNMGIYSRVFPVYDAQADGNYQYKTMQQPPKTTSDLVVHNKKDELVVKFYPEGGNLVDGVRTRVAFEASNELGKKINLIGDVICGGEEQRVQTLYAGRGCFEITPRQGMPMLFKARYNGKEYSFSLPKVERRGYVLNVYNNGDSTRLSVRRNAETEGKTVGLVGYSRGSLVYGNNVDLLTAKEWTMAVSNKDLKTGVNIFTLFTADGSTVAQRQVFVDNHQIDTLFLKADTVSKNLQPYQKININFTLNSSSPKMEVKDGAFALSSSSPKGKAEEGAFQTFSLSVVDAEHTEQSLRNGNILTELLLSSEIKGFVPNPQYYFESDDPQQRKVLDQLLMVQGWSRYDWEEITCKKRFEPYFRIEKGLSFKGRVMRNDALAEDNAEYTSVYDRIIKKPIWVNLELETRYNGNFTKDVKTDSMGRFHIGIRPFYGKSEAFLFLNRYNRSVLGKSAGPVGHVRAVNSVRDTTLELTHFIRPENVVSPMPRPYDYYETQQYDEGQEKTLVADGVLYDFGSQSYVLNDIVKRGRKKWTKFQHDRPTFTVGVRDMAAFVSNLRGVVKDFYFNDYFNNMNIELFMHYYGLSGGVTYYVDEEELIRFPSERFPSPSPKFSMGYGTKESLPENVRFFPQKENFMTLNIYADMENREMLYNPPRYNYLATNLAGDEPGQTKRWPFTIRAGYDVVELVQNGLRMPVTLFRKIVFNGIAEPVEYYHPDYSKLPLPEHKDYRRTLYWNPNVKTDSRGRARVEFYNNSTCRQVAVSAEGITADGKVIIVSPLK